MNSGSHSLPAISDQKSRRRVSAFRWLVGFTIMIPLVTVWAMFLGGGWRTYKVISGSMIPTLKIGDCVVMERQDHYGTLRGKIIAFADPDVSTDTLTKRVVAGENEVVRIKSGRLYVNDEPEPRPHETIKFVPDREWRIGSGQVFVVGDNRNDSFDSIDYGPISRSNILGVVTYRYWPWSSRGKLK